MKKMHLIAVFLLFAVTLAHAGQLTPGLIKAFEGKPESETLPVLIVLSDHIDAVAMGNRLEKVGFALSEVHQIVMDTLKTKAARTQPYLINSIKILEASGIAKNVQTFWITNLVAAEMTRAAAELLITREDVEEIGLDFEITLRNASALQPAGPKTNPIETGLTRIHAPEVWALGFHGEDRIVCSFENGVDQTHPALKARYRGNVSPAAQCWWQPDHASTPSFCSPQGTLTMGILCGADAAAGDTIGVAPGARWIGAKIICESSSRISNVLAAYQWAADPDGRSSTMNDVPDVINNAWGIIESCESSGPQGWWEAIDNTEVLGPVNIFAVDNGGSSVKSPESRAITTTRNFGVGNLDGNSDALTINPTSGRGPSPCDNTSIKPELSAPGTSVRSCAPKGSYSLATGTTLAAAHVSGVVALMRQANPNLSANEIKQILLQTATDLGSSGEDNDYGWGIVNSLAAVQASVAKSTTGAVQGTVTYGGQYVTGAKITVVGNGAEYYGTTNSTGFYRIENLVGDRKYRVYVGRFGFTLWKERDNCTVPQGGTVSVNADLHRGFEDDCEFDQGWSLGVSGDDATGGIWVRATPVPSYSSSQIVQPGQNHSAAGTKCFVTGNAPSPDDPPTAADVSGGHTTLRSPLFSAEELINPTLHFSYYFTNDQGENSGGDFFKAQISNDAGKTWVDLINTSASPRKWQEVSLTITDFVTLSSQMMIQFIAEDNSPASLVEALVDDIFIKGEPGIPEPPRDLTLDVQFDQVVLKWRSSEGATGYRVYLWNEPENIVKTEHFYASTPDTTMTIPMNEIPYSEFYFQITATNR